MSESPNEVRRQEILTRKEKPETRNQKRTLLVSSFWFLVS